MEKSILVKLRQRETNDVSTNGTYNVSLKEPVIIEEGDVVKMHTAILDTSTESFVTLHDDTDITMTCANYVRNYKFDSPLTQQFQKTINYTQPDLNVYFPCFEQTLTGNEYKLNSVDVFARRAGRTEEFVLLFSYDDPVTGL